MNKFNRFAVASAVVLGGVAPAFAEGESGSGGVTSALLTDYITQGQTEVVTLLTAGAAIVGAFFIWGLIKKALNRSK